MGRTAPRIVIVGGGRRPVQRASPRAPAPAGGRPRFVTPRNHMTYQPFLPEAAVGSLEPRHVVPLPPKVPSSPQPRSSGRRVCSRTPVLRPFSRTREPRQHRRRIMRPVRRGTSPATWSPCCTASSHDRTPIATSAPSRALGCARGSPSWAVRLPGRCTTPTTWHRCRQRTARCESGLDWALASPSSGDRCRSGPTPKPPIPLRGRQVGLDQPRPSSTEV